MARSAVLNQDLGYLSTLPLGSVIGWHRDFVADPPPSLPPGWLECNGQRIDDPESPYHGHVTPDLNGGAGEGEGGHFLRGGTESGRFQQDTMQRHGHRERDPGHTHSLQLFQGVVSGRLSGAQQAGRVTSGGSELTDAGVARVGDPEDSESGAGDPRLGVETRPVNMSVVWIMKVKQVTAVRAVTALEAHPQAPMGSVYISAEGRVGIGMTGPGSALDVAGTVRATRFQGDGSALTNVPCTCRQELAGGRLAATTGEAVEIRIERDFLGFVTVMARSADARLVSMHRYMVAGGGSGEGGVRVAEIGSGMVGDTQDTHLDVVLVLAPDGVAPKPDTVYVVAPKTNTLDAVFRALAEQLPPPDGSEPATGTMVGGREVGPAVRIGGVLGTGRP